MWIFPRICKTRLLGGNSSFQSKADTPGEEKPITPQEEIVQYLLKHRQRSVMRISRDLALDPRFTLETLKMLEKQSKVKLSRTTPKGGAPLTFELPHIQPVPPEASAKEA